MDCESNYELQITKNQVSITVVYDNNPFKEGLETRWGFSALITGTEGAILFDTGRDGSMLMDNMGRLAIEPGSIDLLVLSHIHPDHTGGLDSFLGKNSKVTVYLLKSFPKKFKDNVRTYGLKIVEVEQSVKICENVYLTGRLGRLIKEQALIVKADKGLIVIAGCAHAGIVRVVNTAKDLLKDDILLVIGGFHLEWATRGKIKKVISDFRRMGVRYTALCHCSGDRAKALFEKHYGQNCINVGAGKVITIADLQ